MSSYAHWGNKTYLWGSKVMFGCSIQVRLLWLSGAYNFPLHWVCLHISSFSMRLSAIWISSHKSLGKEMNSSIQCTHIWEPQEGYADMLTLFDTSPLGWRETGGTLECYIPSTEGPTRTFPEYYAMSIYHKGAL